ncbi:MAG: undecaprenyl-diphosphate phosphatase [Bacteroidales bacterium]
MDLLQALILGIIQGLTEFLPVSSSGHLELGAALFSLKEENLTFSIIVHGATFLSVLVVFRQDIFQIIYSLVRFRWDDETKYLLLLILSAIPVGVVGLLFKDNIEGLFEGRIAFVGAMLLVTALLLFLTRFAPKKSGKINAKNAIIIGFAQTLAVLPGISRSGATISTALYLGVDRERAARFSFLMVLIPIFGASFLEVLSLYNAQEPSSLSTGALIVGAVAAFVSGLFACSSMIQIVKKGKLVWFAAYCAIVGVVSILIYTV